jgi:hypothetical protein
VAGQVTNRDKCLCRRIDQISESNIGDCYGPSSEKVVYTLCNFDVPLRVTYTSLHSATNQKTANFILAAVRTLSRTWCTIVVRIVVRYSLAG